MFLNTLFFSASLRLFFAGESPVGSPDLARFLGFGPVGWRAGGMNRVVRGRPLLPPAGGSTAAASPSLSSESGLFERITHDHIKEDGTTVYFSGGRLKDSNTPSGFHCWMMRRRGEEVR